MAFGMGLLMGWNWLGWQAWLRGKDGFFFVYFFTCFLIKLEMRKDIQGAEGEKVMAGWRVWALGRIMQESRKSLVPNSIITFAKGSVSDPAINLGLIKSSLFPPSVASPAEKHSIWR